VFAGAEADDERIRVWKFAVEVCQREIRRLNEELGERNTSGGRQGRPGRRPAFESRAQDRTRNLSQWERDKLRQERDEVIETLTEYDMKLRAYGFRIEDPDIQERRQDDDGP
jgi:hypothetical protein